MTKTRGVVYGVLICAGIVLLWVCKNNKGKTVNTQIKSTVLPANDQAKVIVDPLHHTITVLRRVSGPKIITSITVLPRHGASIDIGPTGSVVVTAPKWGTEIDPFVGGAFGSDIRLRAALGLDLLYIQRWEMGGGLLVDSDIRDTRVFVQVSYNVYANYYMALGVDNKQTAHLMAGLKF